MKQITTAEQPWLSFKRTLAITIDGIRYRLFRASVTVAIITLAVAFLMNVLAEGLIKNSVSEYVTKRQAINRLVYDWSSRLTVPGDCEFLLKELASTSTDSQLYRECMQLSGMNDKEMSRLYEQAQSIVSFFSFLDRLDYAKRRSLAHATEGFAIFKWLQSPENMSSFKQALSFIHSVKCPLSQDELDTLSKDYDEIAVQLHRILDARSNAIQKVTEQLNGRNILEALDKADADFGDAIRQAGFILDAENEAPIISSQSKQLQDSLITENLLESRLIYQNTDSNGTVSTRAVQPARQLLAQILNKLPADITSLDLWKVLESTKNAQLFAERIKEMRDSVSSQDNIQLEGMSLEELSDACLPPKRFNELAAYHHDSNSIEKASRLIGSLDSLLFGLDERMAWLLFISMLVCCVGITNAMMMSVTERFNEIATLKCLGALDGFIMLMFVLESCAMGIVGGCIGALLGGIIGFFRMLFSFGIDFFPAMPWGALLLGMVASVILGTILAAIAAIIPSFKAAHLAPMEAMRVE